MLDYSFRNMLSCFVVGFSLLSTMFPTFAVNLRDISIYMFLVSSATAMFILSAMCFFISWDGDFRKSFIKIAVDRLVKKTKPEDIEMILNFTECIAYVKSTIFSGNSSRRPNIPTSRTNIRESTDKYYESAVLLDNILVIKFEHDNNNYELLVPYNKSKARSHIKYFSRQGLQLTELKHHPGLELLVTAQDLNVEEIVTNDQQDLDLDDI